MARFDVYRNPSGGAADTPYVLDVQADLLEDLKTRVVIPLRRRGRFPDLRPPSDLVPAVEVEGIECLLETPKLAAVPVRVLGSPIASLAGRRNDITRAIDFLFQGY